MNYARPRRLEIDEVRDVDGIIHKTEGKQAKCNARLMVGRNARGLQEYCGICFHIDEPLTLPSYEPPIRYRCNEVFIEEIPQLPRQPRKRELKTMNATIALDLGLVRINRRKF